MPTVELRVNFDSFTCVTCGIVSIIPSDLFRMKKRDGEAIYCPNGHDNYWDIKPEPKPDNARLMALHQQEQEEARQAEAKAKADEALQHAVALQLAQPKASDSSPPETISTGAIPFNAFGRVPCPKCDRDYANRTWLDRHLRRVHRQQVA